MFGGHSMGGGFGMGAGYMGLIWIVVLIVLVAAAWWFIRSLKSSRSLGNRSDHPETPEEILRRRFARGEIDEEEFHRRSDVLKR